jgi:uncharacterized membrane protein YadS
LANADLLRRSRPRSRHVQSQGSTVCSGIALYIVVSAVSAAAIASERLEAPLFGGFWFEPLVTLAILAHAWVTPQTLVRWDQLQCQALLEVAVRLLGSAISGQVVVAIGPRLVGGIAAVVLISIAAAAMA